MGSDQPLLLVLVIGGSGVVAKWWRDDYRAMQAGHPPPQPLPGTSPAPRRAHLIALVGALLLVAAETGGENLLGISGEQSRVTVLFGLHTLAAAFLEELIFRGYVVVDGRGRAALVASILAASVLFALLHPFLWDWRDGTLYLESGTKAWFSTSAIFVGSLWFYFLRFMPTNPKHSLLPCVTAHVAKNLAVFAVKLVQGHVSGWW